MGFSNLTRPKSNSSPRSKAPTHSQSSPSQQMASMSLQFVAEMKAWESFSMRFLLSQCVSTLLPCAVGFVFKPSGVQPPVTAGTAAAWVQTVSFYCLRYCLAPSSPGLCRCCSISYAREPPAAHAPPCSQPLTRFSYVPSVYLGLHSLAPELHDGRDLVTPALPTSRSLLSTQ